MDCPKATGKDKDARLVATRMLPDRCSAASCAAFGEVAEAEDIIIDAKSGVSGDRAARQPYHFPECTENFKAYKITGQQFRCRVLPRLQQAAEDCFTPI